MNAARIPFSVIQCVSADASRKAAIGVPTAQHRKHTKKRPTFRPRSDFPLISPNPRAYTVGRASQVEGSLLRQARATHLSSGPGALSRSASRSVRPAR
jgi:hypothetical protein